MTGYVHISNRQPSERKTSSVREAQAALAAQRYKALYEQALVTCDSLKGQVERLKESLSAAGSKLKELELKVQQVEARSSEVQREETVYWQGYLKQGAMETIKGLIQ